MRLGALGFALNFVSLGSIGGDLFKAIFAAKDSPGRRTEAVATVVARPAGRHADDALAGERGRRSLIDWTAAPPAIKVLVQTIRLATVADSWSAWHWCSSCRHSPAIGFAGLVERGAARGSDRRTLDRHRRASTATRSGSCSRPARSASSPTRSSFSRSISSHKACPSKPRRSSKHFVIVPIANLAGAIPATPSGLGTMELAVDKLYQAVPTASSIPAGDGTLVALGQRATMILVAAVCLAFYVLQRGDLREAMHEIEEVEAAAEAM